MTPTALQTELESALAKGTAASDVEAYLKGRNIEHSGIIDNAALAHLGEDPASFAIKAIVRKSRQSPLVTTDIAMTFTFDRDRKLTEIAVKEMHSGL